MTQVENVSHVYKLTDAKGGYGAFRNIEIAIRIYLVLTATNCCNECSSSKLKEYAKHKSTTQEHVFYLVLW